MAQRLQLKLCIRISLYVKPEHRFLEFYNNDSAKMEGAESIWAPFFKLKMTVVSTSSPVKSYLLEEQGHKVSGYFLCKLCMYI